MRILLICVISLMIPFQNLDAQANGSQVYLFDLNQISDSIFIFSNPKYLTAFNPDGYNNQPAFNTANELYLTVQQKGEDQTEIYSLDLENNTKTKVTETITSEYSPSICPDKKHFTVVRVEEDKSQRLWKFPLNRSNNGSLMLEDIEDIGYHFWYDEYNLALFIVGEPHAFMLAKPKDGSSKLITSNIGRCFGKLPNGKLVFVHKIIDSHWSIKTIDVHSNQKELLTYTLPQAEDFVITPDGTIIMGSGSKLYKFNKKMDKTWVPIADFSRYNINKISRIALSGNNKLALVSQ